MYESLGLVLEERGSVAVAGGHGLLDGFPQARLVLRGAG